MQLDAKKIRKDFPILSTKANGKRLIYLDNAATSQKPNSVIDAVTYYYKNYNSNIHRGIYKISEKATEKYTESKELAAKLIRAGSYRNIVYLRNTTEAINLIARTWAEENMKKGERVLITEMEHHSNIVPWQLLAKRKGIILDYAKLRDKEFIDMDDYKEKLERKPKLVSFTHVSNVLGTINDAKEMTRLAHKAGAVVLLGCGAVRSAHAGERQGDWLRLHGILGPQDARAFGVGVLYGKEDLLETMPPYSGGGDMIRTVDYYESTWNELPWKFEAGTQNIEGAIGFGAAIEYLNTIGMEDKAPRDRTHEICA